MLSMVPNASYALQLSRHATKAEVAMERVSSGTKLDHAWDDPADFTIAEAVRKQGAAATEVKAIIQDAINIVRIGQDGVQSIVDIVQSLRDVVVEAANGTHSPEQNAIFQTQLETQRGLLLQAYETAKNFRVRLDGLNADRVLHFQVGTGAGEVFSIDYNPLREDLRDLIMGVYGYEGLFNDPQGAFFLAGAGIYPIPAPTDIVPPPPLGPNVPPGTTWAEAFPSTVRVDPPTKENIEAAFTQLDRSKTAIVAQEAYLGICSNRLENHLEVMQAFEVQMELRESNLRDADLAEESTHLTKAQVLQQASQAMLAQANTRALQVIELLRQG